MSCRCRASGAVCLFALLASASGVVGPSTEATFSLQDGYILRGGDLLVQTMTVQLAKKMCSDMSECAGFTHEGPPPPDEDGVGRKIFLKRHWIVEGSGWTSYRVLRPSASPNHLRQQPKEALSPNLTRSHAPAAKAIDEVPAGGEDFEDRVRHVSDDPRIYQIDDFLSHEECDFMLRHGEPGLQRSLTIDRETGEYHPDTVRTNMQMYVSMEDSRHHPVISRIVRRMHRAVRVPLGHAEQMQVGRYRVGEKYDCHYDSEVRVGVLRAATLIVYISDVLAGGDTLFPMGHACTPLVPCCSGNGTTHEGLLRVLPKKGEALVFYTHNLDGSQNMRALHCSCPVERGVKWIIQGWFRTALYDKSPHYPLDGGENVGPPEPPEAVEL